MLIIYNLQGRGADNGPCPIPHKPKKGQTEQADTLSWLASCEIVGTIGLEPMTSAM